MYRNTHNNLEDLQSICNIYNDITNRNRTPELHKWEWFSSPYKNKSYVIIDKDDNILGHHGILTIKLEYKDKEYISGKTENTIMKKGYGPLYFKNEMEMHKDYLSTYHILITTTAHGVTKKIREKLGYKVFSEYVSYVRIVDFNFLSKRINNKLLQKAIKYISPLFNIFIFNSYINKGYIVNNEEVTDKSLVYMVEFYKNIEKKHFYQKRSKEFLAYRILNNPYKKYHLFTIDFNSSKGFILYYINDNKVIIEDILYSNIDVKNDLMNLFFSYIKENKSAYLIYFITLENSVLDKPMKNYTRRINKKNDNRSRFMIKNNIEDTNKSDFKIENFYFTQLMMEGIS